MERSFTHQLVGLAYDHMYNLLLSFVQIWHILSFEFFLDLANKCTNHKQRLALCH